MTGIYFDTAAQVQHLQEAGFELEQARAIIQSVQQSQYELVTRKDLNASINTLKIYILSSTGLLTLLLGAAKILITQN